MKKFISRYSRKTPITGSRVEMQSGTIRGEAGSEEQAESQIDSAPAPFANPRGAIRGAGTNQQFTADQPQGSAAPNLKGGNPHRAEPRSAPMSHSAGMKSAGYPANYRAPYAPSTHKAAKARTLRGGIPGAKPLVDNSDVFSPEGIAAWNAGRRGL